MTASIDTDTDAALGALFAPRSIAIVGASDNPGKIGGIPLDYQRRFGYGGEVHAVNPRGGLVQGLPAHASLRAIGRPVDLAVIAVPAAAVEGALEDAAAAGVRGIVLFSSGYAEIGPAGAAAQRRLKARARAAGMRLLGPNCLGFMNPARQVYATFSPAPGAGRVPAGRVGLVSQSGAFGAYAYSMARERGIGLSLWATTGNEADVQVADVIAWLARDPATDVIMVYLEGCRDGARLRAALDLARQHSKTVVAVKVGTTPLGAAAAASHTAALAGDDAVYDAVFRQHGVLRARTVQEFFDLASSAAIAGRPRDRTVGLFTVSGGVGALMADEVSALGLEATPLSDAAQATLREWVPFAAPRNPVDITGQVTNDPTLMQRAARLMLDDRGYATWMGFFAAAGASDKFWPVLRGLAADLRAAYPDTIIALSTLVLPARRAELEAMGCLIYTDPSVGLRALAALAARPPEAEPPTDADPFAPVPRVAPGPLSEASSLACLAEAGVPVTPWRLVQDAAEAVVAQRAFGVPVVLKVASADIPHKSDVGGVALGLSDAHAVAQAHDRVLAAVRTARPDAHLDGLLVAPMARGGIECLAGVHRDPVFGPVLVVGRGGTEVELLRDVALRALPVGRPTLRAMLDELRMRPLLDAHRGRPAADIEGLLDALEALAGWAWRARDTLESLDINPLLVRPANQGGCLALDALVVGRSPDTATETPA